MMATADTSSFIKLMKHPVKFRMFLFSKLPSAFFSGVRIKDIDEAKCVVTVPYKWFSQNPFRSTYFASLAMAAEMSTGTLALSGIYKRVPAISMLVTKMEAVYFKKATGIIFFSCEDGKEIAASIEEAVTTGDPKKIIVKSTGIDKKDQLVAEFLFTWSFKAKSGSKS